MKYLLNLKFDLKKTTSNDLIDISIEDHINFNTTLTKMCQNDIRNLTACQECPLFFAINRKRFCQTLSVVDISITAFSFGCSVSIMNKTFILRSIPYSIKYQRDVNRQLPKIVY